LRITVRGNAETRLCFLANPTDSAQQTTLQSAAKLRGVWNAVGDYAGEPLTIPPYTIQIWEVLQ
jgi:hypothetical protein